MGANQAIHEEVRVMKIRRGLGQHGGDRKLSATENKAGSTTADVDARSWAEGWQPPAERPRILVPTAKDRIVAATPPPADELENSVG